MQQKSYNFEQHRKAVTLRNEDPHQEPMEILVFLCLQMGGLSFPVAEPDAKNFVTERQAEVKCSVAGPFGRLTYNWLPSLVFHLLNISQISPTLWPYDEVTIISHLDCGIHLGAL